MATLILPEGWDKPTTNADIIRHMTIEELASFLDAVADDAYESRNENKCYYPVGYQAWHDWLKQEWQKQEATDVK